MIKNEKIRRGGPEEEMIRLAQQGNVETILRHKEAIDLVDLFLSPQQSPNPPSSSPSRICLIEGAPGGGKSTFALHICHQWAQGASWLARFDVVVLAYLRDVVVQNATSLAEILPARNMEMCQSNSSHIQATDGKNVLFVFDGWDEFPKKLMKDSLVSSILRQPHKLSLHQSTVLITSRPVSSGNLLNIADRRVEILGFTQQQIRDYIEKALEGNSAHIQQLVRHLEEHPVIEGYCYIPLHLAILVNIFLTMKGALPTTHHELFCSLILCCIVREQETHEPDTSLPVMSSLDDLPDDLKSKLNNLSLLAYNGVMQEKIIFYLKDLQSSDLPTNLPSLGLLQTTEGFALCSKLLSYNFLHLSVQELLAAYRISQMDPSEQVKVFMKLFGSPRFQAVLQYYSGFTKLDNPEIQQFICSYHSDMTHINEYLPILKCFFEAKQPFLSQLVDPTRFMDIDNYSNEDQYSSELTPVDFLAVGYFIVSFLSTCRHESNNNTPTLYLFETIDDHCLKLLLDELSKNPVRGLPTLPGALSEKLVLKLYVTDIDIAGLKNIASYLKTFSLIGEVTLNSMKEEVVLNEFVVEMLHTNNSITKLSLQYNLNEFNDSLTLKCVHLNKPLTQLHLSSLSDELLHIIIAHLQYSTTLVKLSISKPQSRMTVETARALTMMLEVNKSLTHLVLHSKYFSDHEAFCVFKVLQNNTTLISLDLSNCDITAADPEIIKSLMLQENSSLMHLNLSGNIGFSDSGARCIFESLQYNSTLVYLNLCGTSTTANDPDTAKSLTKMLRVNKSLTHLDLSCKDTIPANRIISLIFSALEHNTTLLHLVLCCRDISIDDAECIAQALKSNQSLLTIDISRAYISRIDIILAALKFNTTLKSMRISYNWAADVAVEDLQRARKESGLPPVDIVYNQLPPAVGSYVSYLGKLYKSMSQSQTSLHYWAHLPQCEFIQLAMIKNEKIRRGGPEEEMIRLAQQGNVETILRHKESINLVDLFLSLQQSPNPPSSSPGRICLIEGAPGGGNSTFALHICHQWAQGASWLARFDVVILAYLRDEAVQNATSLADILPARNMEMCQSNSSHIQATDGKNVLFVFDGWDEFPPDLMNVSLVSTILRQPHKLSLHRSTVLITSRPVSSGNLLNIADRRVEILGFTQQQIRDYIEKALEGNSAHIQQLVRHLKEHPVIEGYCYIPLHLAILVHIFLTMKGALPTTHHKLFCSLILCCIVREQETHEPDTNLPEMSSLDDLPDYLKSKLNNLSLLAYNGIMQGKIIFYLKDLQSSNLPTNIPSLGLLQTTEGFALCSKSLSYNFLHLSVQELLAAYHISQMDSSEQVEVFKKLFTCPRFQAVLQYYCGFTKLDNPEIQQFISSYHIEMPDILEYLPILKCFFEAKEPSLSQLVDPTKFMGINSYDPDEELYYKLTEADLTPVDFLAIGYFIVSFLSTCGHESNTNIPILYLEIGLSTCIDDHCLKLLLDEFSKIPTGGLSTSAGALSEKLVLNLFVPHIDIEGFKYIASYLKTFSLIGEVTLSSWKEEVVPNEFIVEMLHTNNSITKLSLLFNSAHKFKYSLTIKCAYLNKPLTELHLSLLSDELLHIIIAHLQYSTTLVKLSISKPQSGMTVETARALTMMLQVNNSLTHLVVSHSKYFSDHEAFCVFKGLQHNTTLISLDLSNCDITAADPEIIKSLMLQENSCLTHLNLSGNIGFSDTGARCIFESLQYNSTLVYLNLGGTSITATDSDTAKSLTKMLQVNKSLTHLDLSCKETYVPANRIISLIFSALKHNTTLLHLVLRCREISKDDAECIALALKSNKSLLTIDISRAYISRIDIIFAALKFNTTLKTMCISYNLAADVADFQRARKESGLPPIDIVLHRVEDLDFGESLLLS